jgi:hypothetical protein
MSVGPRHCLRWFVYALTAAALVGAPAASAGDDPSPHGDVSSVAQYVEDIPTADGPIVAGGSGGAEPPPPPAALEPGVDETISRSGGTDAPKLRDIATKPALGAPARRLTGPRTEALGDPSAASAVASATTGGGTAVIAVLALIGLVTVAAAAVAVHRARS